MDAPADKDASAPVQRAQDNAVEAAAPDAGDKPRGFLTKVAKTIDKGHRWYLERDEPDATGRWDDDHRRSMLRYVYDRDGGRCGLCAGETKIKGAQIEHVVPKVFVLFDVDKGGKAEPGTQYKSRLHKIDNLQAAHTYCNKRKANTPEVAKWTSGGTRPYRHSPSRTPKTDGPYASRAAVGKMSASALAAVQLLVPSDDSSYGDRA